MRRRGVGSTRRVPVAATASLSAADPTTYAAPPPPRSSNHRRIAVIEFQHAVAVEDDHVVGPVQRRAHR